MAWRPSGVLGPVLSPPWFLQRPLTSAFALHGLPVERAKAPQVCFFFTAILIVSKLEEHLVFKVDKALLAQLFVSFTQELCHESELAI